MRGFSLRNQLRAICLPGSLGLYLAAVVIPGPVLPSVESALIQDRSRDRMLIDDFERAGPDNALGKRSGAFADSKGLGYCYVFFTDKADQTWGGGGHSLYLKFDTAKPGAWAGYWTDLGHANLGEFKFLTFYLKGLRGGELFKIGLRGERETNYETKLPIGAVVAGGVTTQWQKVSIPLKLFQTVRNWEDVGILSFNFEFSEGSRSGAILIDEIAFEK
jgi:hypothetical protein